MVSGTRITDVLIKSFPPPQLRKRRGCEQVAAVCFRFGGNGIEFLLVRTRGGRWTFPKGGLEPGLSHAQAAAMEAFEEAGVHGRIEELSFAHYTGRKRGKTRESDETRLVVHAHLCEVSRLSTPQESNRNPTWFSAEKARRRLREERTVEHGAELVRVVDRAVARIQRLRNGRITRDDAFYKVQFEAFQDNTVQVQQAPYRHIRRQDGANGHFAAIALAADAYLCKVLRLGPGDRFNGNGHLFSRGKANREAGNDGCTLGVTRLAMRLQQTREASGASTSSPLQIIKTETRRGTQSAGKRGGNGNR